MALAPISGNAPEMLRFSGGPRRWRAGL